MPLRLAQLITGEQVNSIKLINGTPHKNRLVVVTQTGTQEIQIIEKDHEGVTC